MRKPSRNCYLLILGLVTLLMVVVIVVGEYSDRLPVGFRGVAEPVLFLSSEAPVGHYHDAAEGARMEEEERQIGVELSSRPARGPIVCRIRAIPGMGSPELEVELTNLSLHSVTLTGHQLLLDYVTFTLRDPDERIVSTFCYANMHSIDTPKPAITIKPGSTETGGSLFLSVAAGRGFRPLQPGVYSIEATFHEPWFGMLPMFDERRIGMPRVPEQKMLARSNRLPIRVAPK